MRVRHRFRAFEQVGLPKIILRHGPVDLPKTPDQNRFLLERQQQLATKRLSGGITRDVIFSRTEAADENDDLRALQRIANRVGQALAIIADHELPHNLHTQPVEMLGHGQRVCIDPLWSQQFASHSNDFCVFRHDAPKAKGGLRCLHRRDKAHCAWREPWRETE